MLRLMEPGLKERIEITPFAWILLSGRNWMISIDGCGSCGSAASRQGAIKQILNSSRLSAAQKSIISQSKVSGEQLELF